MKERFSIYSSFNLRRTSRDDLNVCVFKHSIQPAQPPSGQNVNSKNVQCCTLYELIVSDIALKPCTSFTVNPNIYCLIKAIKFKAPFSLA